MSIRREHKLKMGQSKKIVMSVTRELRFEILARRFLFLTLCTAAKCLLFQLVSLPQRSIGLCSLF
jgi:hypothetical protein